MNSIKLNYFYLPEWAKAEAGVAWVILVFVTIPVLLPALWAHFNIESTFVSNDEGQSCNFA